MSEFTDPHVSFPVVTEPGFPSGLRCAVCHREIEPGQPYTSAHVSFVHDTPVLVLLCVYCPPSAVDLPHEPPLYPLISPDKWENTEYPPSPSG